MTETDIQTIAQKLLALPARRRDAIVQLIEAAYKAAVN